MGFREWAAESERRGRAVRAEGDAKTARTFTEHSFGWLFAWVAGPILALTIPILVIALWNAQGDHRVARQLAQDGIVARARVVDQRAWGRPGVEYYHQARVSFTTETGQAVVTWVSTDSSFVPGRATPDVRYSRRAPTVVRVVGEEFPLRDDWRVPAIFAGVVLVLSVGVIALARYHWRIWVDLHADS